MKRRGKSHSSPAVYAPPRGETFAPCPVWTDESGLGDSGVSLAKVRDKKPRLGVRLLGGGDICAGGVSSADPFDGGGWGGLEGERRSERRSERMASRSKVKAPPARKTKLLAGRVHRRSGRVNNGSTQAPGLRGESRMARGRKVVHAEGAAKKAAIRKEHPFRPVDNKESRAG